MPVDTTKNWRWKRLIKSAAKYVCAKGSIRTKAVQPNTRLRFCCPKGEWDKRKNVCRVGTLAIAKGKRRNKS